MTISTSKSSATLGVGACTLKLLLVLMRENEIQPDELLS